MASHSHSMGPIPDPAAGMDRMKLLTRRLLTVTKKDLNKSLAGAKKQSGRK